MICNLCPRNCGIDRNEKTGFCGCGNQLTAAKAMLHLWEEPCLIGEKGAGTVFFSGCNLKCCFCQNKEISQNGFGKPLTESRLTEIFMEMDKNGAYCLDLVTGTPWIPEIINALKTAKFSRKMPVVWNTGGYETTEAVRKLSPYVDIWLTDLKFYDPELSGKYCKAPDYFEVASESLKEMVKLAGKPVFGENGMLRSGVIVRHLVMPSHAKDSLKLVEWLKENFESDDLLLSLMSQYTPQKNEAFKELKRPITTYEYRKVLEAVQDAGFDGYSQERTSAKEEYTPDFDGDGI